MKTLSNFLGTVVLAGIVLSAANGVAELSFFNSTLIAINDNIADGRDISWLWDVDFEHLAGRADHVIVAGLRAEDMALRLRYAGIPDEAVDVQPGYEPALRSAVSRAAGRPVVVLPTYTAMLGIRDVLRRWGAVGRYWEH